MPSSGSLLAAVPYGATAGGAPAPPLATSLPMPLPPGASALFGPLPGERPRPQGTSPWIGVIVLVAIVGMFLWYEYAHKHAADHAPKHDTPAAGVAH